MSLMNRTDGASFYSNEADDFLQQYSDSDILRFIIDGDRFMRTAEVSDFLQDMIEDFADRHPDMTRPMGVERPLRDLVFPLWLTAAIHRAFDQRNAGMFEKEDMGYNSLPDGHDPMSTRIGLLVRDLDDDIRRLLVDDLNHVLHVKEDIDLVADEIEPPAGIDPGSRQSWAIILGMAVAFGYSLDRRNAIAFHVEKDGPGLKQ